MWTNKQARSKKAGKSEGNQHPRVLLPDWLMEQNVLNRSTDQRTTMLILAQASLYSSYSCVAAVAQRNSLGASAADSTASVMADDDEEVRVSTRKIKVVEIRLTEAMAAHATDTLDRAMDTISVEKDMAQVVKLAFDKTYGGTWHCIVGRNFGCSVTHETKYLVFFKVDHLSCLLFCSDLPTGPPPDYGAKKSGDN